MSCPWASAGLTCGAWSVTMAVEPSTLEGTSLTGRPCTRAAPAGTTTPCAYCVHWPPGAYCDWSPTLLAEECIVRVVHWPPGAHLAEAPMPLPPPANEANGDAPPHPCMSWPRARAGLTWGAWSVTLAVEPSTLDGTSLTGRPCMRAAPAGTTAPSAYCVHWPPGAYWLWSPT